MKHMVDSIAVTPDASTGNVTITVTCTCGETGTGTDHFARKAIAIAAEQFNLHVADIDAEEELAEERYLAEQEKLLACGGVL